MTGPDDPLGDQGVDESAPWTGRWSGASSRAAGRVSWAWLVWGVLAGVAADLGVLVLQAYRLLFVGQLAFYAEPEPGSPPSLYSRLAALTQLLTPDRTLAVAVVGLLAVAWVAAGNDVPQPARQVGAALAGLTLVLSAALAAGSAYLLVGQPQGPDGGSFFGDQALTQVGGPLGAGVVLACVCALLARALLTAPPVGAAAGQPDPAEVPEPAGRGAEEQPPEPDVPVDDQPSHEVPVSLVPVSHVPVSLVRVSEVPVSEVPVSEVPVDGRPQRSPFARPVLAGEPPTPPGSDHEPHELAAQDPHAQDPHAPYRRPVR